MLSQQPYWISALVAGAVARTGAVTLVSPLELIRTKMQSKKLTYRGKRKKNVNELMMITDNIFFLQRFV